MTTRITRLEAVEWWEAHGNVSPTLLLICGVDKCPKVVGEVKESDGIALALMYTVFAHGPQLAPVQRNTETWPPKAIAYLAELERYRDAQKVLRDGLDVPIGEQHLLLKRHQEPGPPLVLAVDDIAVFICSENHGKVGRAGNLPAGVFPLEAPDVVVAEIRRVLADTTHGSKRRFALSR